jgi:hypothetical protein
MDNAPSKTPSEGGKSQSDRSKRKHLQQQNRDLITVPVNLLDPQRSVDATWPTQPDPAQQAGRIPYSTPPE